MVSKLLLYGFSDSLGIVIVWQENERFNLSHIGNLQIDCLNVQCLLFSFSVVQLVCDWRIELGLQPSYLLLHLVSL